MDSKQGNTDMQLKFHPRERLCENSKLDATALRRGDSRLLLLQRRRTFRDATALRRGVSRLLLSVLALEVQQET